MTSDSTEGRPAKSCAHTFGAKLGCAECVRDVRARYPEFPLQMTWGTKTAPGPVSVPWPVAEMAWAAYSQRYGRDQSVERLAERGGFSWGEMDGLFPGWREAVDPWRRMAEENGHLRVALADSEGKRGQCLLERAQVEAALTRLWHHVMPASPEEGKAASELRAAFPALPVPQAPKAGDAARACLISMSGMVPLLRRVEEPEWGKEPGKKRTELPGMGCRACGGLTCLGCEDEPLPR